VRQYDLRRGTPKILAGDRLRHVVAEAFGAASEEGGKVVASFGALRRLATWTDGKVLCVDTESDPTVDAPAASETIRRYNVFLERATGYSAKERSKRAKHQVQGQG